MAMRGPCFCITSWAATSRTKKASWRREQGGDLVARINARDATSLPIAEVVRRWQFVPEVFHVEVLSRAADGLVTRVLLRNRSRLAGPIYGCRSADMR
jgi:hypothetical protein